MIHYRAPRTGIDEPIYQLQQLLHEGLKAEWKLGEQDYQCYGRAYKNPVKGGYRPEVYMDDSDYIPVLLDDKYTALSFFGLGDRLTVSGNDNIEQVHIVFFIHLGTIATLKLSPQSSKLSQEDQQRVMKANPARADMEAREAVQAIMNQNLFGFTLTDVTTGPSALDGYAITNFAKFHMHPFYCVRINGTIRYTQPKVHYNN